jgi:hypothetical protein
VSVATPACDEFICADCGAQVFSFPPRLPPPEYCATCGWLREFAPGDEELRRAVRERGGGWVE